MTNLQLPQEQVVTIGGVQYRLSKFGIAQMQEFLAWAKTKIPHPFDKFGERFANLPEAVVKMAYDDAKKAAEVWCTERDPAVESLMNSLDGVSKTLHIMLKKYQPHLTEADVTAIVDSLIGERGDGVTAELFRNPQ